MFNHQTYYTQNPSQLLESLTQRMIRQKEDVELVPSGLSQGLIVIALGPRAGCHSCWQRLYIDYRIPENPRTILITCAGVFSLEVGRTSSLGGILVKCVQS